MAFSLTGTSTGFESRAASVFSALEETVDKNKGEKLCKADVEDFLMPPPRPVTTTQKEESFTTKVSDKRRHLRDRRITPDHIIHPEKWQKYSLEDTDLSTDSQNKQAAFAFLAELRERKSHTKEQALEKSNYSPKFKKPREGARLKTGKSGSIQSQRNSENSARGKTVLKEYVVGVSQPRKRKATNPVCGEMPAARTMPTTLMLSHLEEEEGEVSIRCAGNTGSREMPIVRSGAEEKT